MKYLVVTPIIVLLFAVIMGSKQRVTVIPKRIEPFSIPDSTIVPIHQALQMIDNYALCAGFVGRDGKMFPNMRSVWFDLVLMEAVVARIRKEGANGIEFHFAAYDDDYGDGRSQITPPERYRGYNTLLLIPTQLKGGLRTM